MITTPDQTACFLCGDCEDRGGVVAHVGSLRVIADRSPLCQGHLLLAPLVHSLSFAEYLDKQPVFVGLHALATAAVGASQPFLMMENGSSSSMRFCGTEHAHLHILPSKAIAEAASPIVDVIVSRLNGQYQVTSWWPDTRVLRAGNWAGYIHISTSDAKFARTIYVREPQQQQLGRSVVASFIGTQDYLYDETVDLPAARRATARHRQAFVDTPVTLPATITLIEGLSGSGKSSVVSQLAAADGAIAIRTGAAFCALVQAQGEAALTAIPESVEGMLLNLREPFMAEVAIGETLRAGAAVLAADGTRWRAVMGSIWGFVQRARPFVNSVIIEGRGFEDSVFRGAGSRFFLHASDQVRAQRTSHRTAQAAKQRDFTDQHRTVGRTRPAGAVVIDTEAQSISDVCAQITAFSHSNIPDQPPHEFRLEGERSRS